LNKELHHLQYFRLIYSVRSWNWPIATPPVTYGSSAFLSLLYVTNYGVSVFNEADTNSQLVTAAELGIAAKPGPFCK